MTDSAAPSPSALPPSRHGQGLLRLVFDYLSGGLLGRALLLAALTLALKIPLTLVGGVVADRQGYEEQAVNSVRATWGKEQTFVGPHIVVPYKTTNVRPVALLPQKLTIEADIAPERRRRGLFAVAVYRANLDVVAEFPTKALRDLATEGNTVDWSAARLLVGVSEDRSLDATTVDVDGNPVEWTADTGDSLSSLQANLGPLGIEQRDTFTVRFRVAFAGSGNLSFVPLGRRTDVSVASPWRSPSFSGRYLPVSQTVGKDGFKATWTTSHLGRGYGQLWEHLPMSATVLTSAFGVGLISPVDAYRETDRAIKYGIMFIGLTFAACLLFELATGTQPHLLQYGLIGLSLCVFYLLLLSFAEQVGFGLAYAGSAAAVVPQATIYTAFLQRRTGPALAFGALLAILYGALYALLQLEDVALLSGSLLLFAMLSLAMWFTRNLHRTQPA